MGGGLIHIFEMLFKKHFWIVNLVIIFLIAMFVALGLSHLISAQLASYTVIRPQVQPEGPADPFDRTRDDQNLLISELLGSTESLDSEDLDTPECRFDEDCEAPLVCEEGFCVEPEPGDEVAELASGDCVSSDIPAALIGTMASANADWSFGVVQDLTTNRTVLVRVGDELAGALVTGVGRNRVYVLNDGAQECLKAGEEPATSRPLASRDTRSSSRSTRPTTRTSSTREEDQPQSSRVTALNLREGVRRTSPTNYEIERSAIDAAMEDPRALQSQAPEFDQNYDDNRRPNGIRLTSIPSGSIFSQLGVRPNDVITEVNGQRITTPQRAMEVYEALQNESHVDLTLLRRGRPRTLTYDIR